jgi:hypothetical protein
MPASRPMTRALPCSLRKSLYDRRMVIEFLDDEERERLIAPQVIDTRPARERDLVLGCPKQIAGRDPIKWHVCRPELTHKFAGVLETAADERPLQTFFEDYPEALLTGLVRPHTGWVIPRPRLPKPDGGLWVPDFMICEWKSVGPDWFIIELESPTKSPVTQAGISQLCNHAAEQINSYKTYIRDHGSFLRENGWPKLHGECYGFIVIGRRSDPNRSRHADKLQAFERQRIEIVSYDRLLKECQSMQDFLCRGVPAQDSPL